MQSVREIPPSMSGDKWTIVIVADSGDDKTKILNQTRALRWRQALMSLWGAAQALLHGRAAVNISVQSLCLLTLASLRSPTGLAYFPCNGVSRA